MKKLLAKFKVGSVVDFGNNNVEANLTAVVNDSPENKTFSIYTPSASLKMHITNPDALGFFIPSKEYLFTVEPAESAGITDECDGTYSIGDNSDAFRDWLDSKGIKWSNHEHFTVIRLQPLMNIFSLGREFQEHYRLHNPK